MSDMPRHHWCACGPDGSRLGASAINLCTYLWTFLPARERLTGGFVFHTAERLATELEVDKRTIERQLRQLREARLLSPARGPQGRAGFQLHVLPLPQDPPSAPPSASPIVPAGIADRSGRGSPIDLSEIADRSGGDRRSSLQRSPIVVAEIADRSGGCKEEQEVKQEVKQEREQDLLALARKLASFAATPHGAPDLGSSRPSLRNLVTLLADGEEPATIERVLRCADRIVARGLEAAAFFGSEMFVGGVWAHWCRSAFELHRLEAAEAEAAEARRLSAEADEAHRQLLAEQAAREGARVEVSALCHRVRQASRRTGLDGLAVILAERDPFEAALAYAPARACEVLEQLLAERGDDVTEAEIRAAVVALGVTPPPKTTPADLRAARERAALEGRSALDVLDGI